MSKKISELDLIRQPTGNESVPLSGDQRITINDLLPVQLQGDKTIDLNGHDIFFNNGERVEFNSEYFIANTTVNGGEDEVATAYMQVNNNTNDGQSGHIGLEAHDDAITSDWQITFNDGIKTSSISQSANASASLISFTADTHAFNGVINLPTQAAPASPNDGDIWREDNTDTGLKYKVGGVVKNIVLE